MQHLSLGFSPCPNDTFIFDQMVHQDHSAHSITYDYVMEDVETLNQWAFEGKLDITKLSYAAFLQLTDQYELLDSGSALGFGVGPLLVCTPETLEKITDMSAFLRAAKIAIPGKYTTAHLLLSLAFREAQNKEEVLFSDIEAGVLDGTFDAGLLIHENRFTYAERGLAKIMDCGAWWETHSQSAIPLGGIVIKKSLDPITKENVNKHIKESIAQSWKNYPTLSTFITENAQEMDETVMRKHINLYVNDHSNTLGSIGEKAIKTLFQKAFEAKLITSIPNEFQ